MRFRIIALVCLVVAVGIQCPGYAAGEPNLAPLGTASASATWPDAGGAYDPVKAIDDNPATRWSGMGSGTEWLQITWTTPQTFSCVVIDNAGSAITTQVQAWNAATGTFETVAAPTLKEYGLGATTVYFAPVTTTILRLQDVISVYSLEVYNVNLSDVPVGAQYAYTGSVTAIFPDWAYVEKLDRSSGIRVQPATALVTGGPDVAPLGTAGASGTWPDPSGTYDAIKCIDGELTTRWSGMGSGTEWWQVSWTTPQTISSVVIYNASKTWPMTVQAWNSATGAFENITTLDLTGWDVTTVNFPAVTTTILRLQNVLSLFQVEAHTAKLNEVVSATGALITLDGERVIDEATVTPLNVTSPVSPVGLTGKSFSVDYAGASTIGLLARTCGRVVAALPDYIYVDDGSGISTDLLGVTGVKVGPVVTGAMGDEFVTVTGIAGVATVSDVQVRTLKPMSSANVQMPVMEMGPNLAPLGTASASTTWPDPNGIYDPIKGIDGDMNTRWSVSADQIYPATYDVTWPTSQTINRVFIKNWTAIDGISVQVWNSDTSAFETVATGDLPWQDTATFGFQ
ncbi:MAG: discoidin domain-containing protein, partial [Armatimonadota bacterium]